MFSSHDTSRQDAAQTSDLPRQTATPENIAVDQNDITRFTMSVAEAVSLFQDQGLSLTERTIQRYCHSGKLRALRVDPDTRQPTDRDNYVFLIDPTSIPERISQVREREEFNSPTVVAASRDETRMDATGRDPSGDDVPAAEPKRGGGQDELEKENEELRSKVYSLEIDKAVRDRMVEQLKEDRKELLNQLEGHVQTMIKQGRTIGNLETRLALALPEGEKELEVPEDDPAPIVDGNDHEAVENGGAEQYRI